MFILKGCKKCGGDLYPEREPGDRDIDYRCLQCGKYAYSRPSVVPMRRKGQRSAYHTRHHAQA